MRVVPIAQCYELQAGEIVPSVRGVLKEVWDRNSGQNAKGDWALQNLLLVDESGKDIKVKLQDRDAVPKTWKGREVYIYCNDGGKGLTGIKAKDDEYRGKVSRILSVTPSAHVELAVPASTPVPTSEPTQNPEPARRPDPEPKQETKTNGNGHSNGNGQNGNPFADVGKVKKGLNKLANLYLHCLEAGCYVRRTYEASHQVQMTNEQFQGCVSSLFIQATRTGLDGITPTGVFGRDE